MIIYTGKDYYDVSRKAANIMSAQIIMKPNAVLGLATGSTPVGMYKQLIEWYKKGDLDFSQITSVNLDEYKGLSGDNDQSYRYFMNTNLFDHVNIDKARTYVPNGLEEDSEKACADTRWTTYWGTGTTKSARRCPNDSNTSATRFSRSPRSAPNGR